MPTRNKRRQGRLRRLRRVPAFHLTMLDALWDGKTPPRRVRKVLKAKKLRV